MSAFDFDSIRAGRDGCPSDLTLDELVAGELTGDALSEVEQHVAGCEACAEQLETLRAGFDVMDVDPRPILAGIRRRADEPATDRGWRGMWGRLMNGWRGAVMPFAAAAAAVGLVFLLLPPSAQPPVGGSGPVTEPGPAVRLKGSLALHVHRLVDGRSEETISGDEFHPGDRIRFVVDLPRAGHVAVVGVESSGALYTAWPVPGAAPETLLGAGDQQILPGAVELDDTPGSETLHLVLCPEATGRPVCTSTGPKAAPTCQPACVTTPFVLRKGAR